jgi:hypothetical protein
MRSVVAYRAILRRQTMISIAQSLARRLSSRPALWLVASLALCCAAASAQVPNPTVTAAPATAMPGEAARDYIFFASDHDLHGHGYVEEEFYLEGTAIRYNTPALATGTVVDSGHPYRTRMVVRRPAHPAKFNGTVLVEWLNVTNGFDADNVWFFSWEHILRAGYAWVGVSAQAVGVNRLKSWSPMRYGSLDVTVGGTITGDALSYDVFSQAGQAIRHPHGIDPLHGLVPRQVIAIGESQSASRLSTYANSIQPLANLYDGILLLSSLGNPIRTDLFVPVFKVLAEWDVTALENTVRQPDTARFVTWEVAGTSHVDKHLRASREPLELRDLGVSSEALLEPTCGVQSIGTTVPTHYVMAAAYEHLVRWIDTGAPAPSAPRIDVPTPGRPALPARDALGHALGGIRLSEFEVPVEFNNGTNTGPGACNRWGYSLPMPKSLLDQLYPHHGRYVSKVAHVNSANVASGYILHIDAAASTRKAATSSIGR